jgi:hypothetical protein
VLSISGTTRRNFPVLRRGYGNKDDLSQLSIAGLRR